MTFRYCLILFFAASLLAETTPNKQPKKHVAENAQTRPSPQRIAEIQAALKAHGYEPGTTWEETQEVCRKIADEHMWQTDHAPDVRVLILVGLGGPHSDPSVAQMQGDRLDKDQRTEAARKSESVQLTKRSSVTAASSKASATSSSSTASANVKPPSKRREIAQN